MVYIVLLISPFRIMSAVKRPRIDPPTKEEETTSSLPFDPVSPILLEEEVGITEYVNPSVKGFACSLKSRLASSSPPSPIDELLGGKILWCRNCAMER